MASYTNNGLISDTDPRYQEGLSIMIPLGLSKKSKPKLTKAGPKKQSQKQKS